MKTFLAIALCFCVGCGVSEQEKLAKRINDKMDLEEAREKRLKLFVKERGKLAKRAESKMYLINMRLKHGKETTHEKRQLRRDGRQIQADLEASISKLNKKYNP